MNRLIRISKKVARDQLRTLPDCVHRIRNRAAMAPGEDSKIALDRRYRRRHPLLRQTLRGYLGALAALMIALFAREGLGGANTAATATTLVSLLALAAFGAGCYGLSLRDRVAVGDHTGQ